MNPDGEAGGPPAARPDHRAPLAAGAPAPTVWEIDPLRQSGAEGYQVLAPEDDSRRDYQAIYDASGYTPVPVALIIPPTGPNGVAKTVRIGYAFNGQKNNLILADGSTLTFENKLPTKIEVRVYIFCSQNTPNITNPPVLAGGPSANESYIGSIFPAFSANCVVARTRINTGQFSQNRCGTATFTPDPVNNPGAISAEAQCLGTTNDHLAVAVSIRNGDQNPISGSTTYIGNISISILFEFAS